MAKATPMPLSSRDDLLKAIETAVARDGAAAILQVDVDRFLEFTEARGHQAGDALLAAAGVCLQATAAKEDWAFFRIGGDEFCLVAPGTGLEQAFLKADKLRLELDKVLGAHADGRTPCTASIGVASIPRDAKTPGELLREGDLALYSAKDQGGDAVGLTPGDEMVMKSSYYAASQLARLKALAERLGKKEAPLLREALDDLLRKHDRT